MRSTLPETASHVIAVLCAAVLIALPSVALGACPAPGSICGAYDEATAVFLANVESVQPEAGPTRSGVVTHVTFRVLEWFKGTLGGDRVDLALGPSSEEVPYAKGQRVLVYARHFGGTWSTACSRTRPVPPADPEPGAVRALRDRQPGGVVEGELRRPDLVMTGRAGGIRVVVRRDGIPVSEVTTDFAGRFRTGWLSPGEYELSVQSSISGLGGAREVVLSRDSRCLSIGALAGR